MNQFLQDKIKSNGYALTSIDLFSGPGGLATGFKWAGILPLIAVEWTNTTATTYSQNHDTDVLELSKMKSNNIHDPYFRSFCNPTDRSILIHGDVNLVTNTIIRTLLNDRFGIDCENETIDIVSGGAPCESFSLAGQRKLGDQRDDLFSNITRIARAVNSKAILFENVKGMFSKKDANGKKGGVFEIICDCFDDPNQDVSYKLISRNPNEVLLRACDYGVPQLRERLFLVSIRRDIVDSHPYKYPEINFGEGKKYPFVTVKDAISDLPMVESGDEATTYSYPQNFTSDNQKDYVKLMRGQEISGMHSKTPTHLKKFKTKSTITQHKGPGHVKRKKELLALIPPKSSMRENYDNLVAMGEIEKYRKLFPNIIYGSRNRRLHEELPSYTITSHCLDEMLHPFIDRAITPREAARLQSFPDWYEFAGPYVQFHGSKEEDKYEQIGDAIPPLLAFALGKEFVKCLNNTGYADENI